MKALIIDDEQKARHLLKFLVEENCPQITEIELAEDLPNGIRVINTFQPDIVFLDIEMPGYSGLQILDFIAPEQVNFELIFTTAYSEYAIKAFELNAIDYLLKPLRDEQVETAVAKERGINKCVFCRSLFLRLV
jgi:two-component system LytT family response regulator